MQSVFRKGSNVYVEVNAVALPKRQTTLTGCKQHQTVTSAAKEDLVQVKLVQ